MSACPIVIVKTVPVEHDKVMPSITKPFEVVNSLSQQGNGFYLLKGYTMSNADLSRMKYRVLYNHRFDMWSNKKVVG